MRIPPVNVRAQAIRAQLKAIRARRQAAAAHLAVIAGLLQVDPTEVSTTVMRLRIDCIEADSDIDQLERELDDLTAPAIEALPDLESGTAFDDPVPPSRPGLWRRISNRLFHGWIAP
jgi:hypothetical protein